MTGRREEIAAGLAAVEERIVAACRAAGRGRDELRLVVVTKTHPASDVEVLRDLGVTDVGENRHPEAGRKREELGGDDSGLRWHFVGGLQSKKAGPVARYADVLHSLDRAKLLGPLSNAAGEEGRVLDVCVQVNLEGRDEATYGRSGVDEDDVAALADAVASTDHLRLAGLMAVAPLDLDPAPAFARLAAAAERLRVDHPDATMLSAGMTDDLEQAVRAGATHLRVGRAVLGARPPLG